MTTPDKLNHGKHGPSEPITRIDRQANVTKTMRIVDRYISWTQGTHNDPAWFLLR